MSTQIQRRRGTTAEHSTFTGVEGELTIDTTKDTAVVHDGTTVGGHPLQKQYPALGSASTPTYSFTGDTNTGIYSPGADQVAISTNGTGRLFVDWNGNVGVGLASAGSAIDARSTAGSATVAIRASSEGAGGTTSKFSLNCGTGAITGDLLATASSTVLGTGGVAIQTTTNHPIVFRTNSSGIEAGGNERLRITSAGLVGVGTSSPSSVLHCVGSKDAANFTIGAPLTTVGGGAFSNYSQVTFENTSGSNANAAIRAYGNIWNSAGSALSLMTSSGGAPVDRLYINSAGNVGIGTTSPGAPLEVAGEIRIYPASGDANLRFGSGGVEKGRIAVDSSSNCIIETAGTERARLTSDGKFLVGTSSALASAFGTVSPRFQVATTTSGPVSFLSYVNDAFAARVDLSKSRGTTIGANTIVTDGDDLGDIYFNGADGTNFIPAALIRGEVDGTPGTNDMPGRLVFSTTADGASSPTERMRIRSDGAASFGQGATGPGSGVAGTLINAGDGGILITNNTNPFLRCYTLNGGFPDALQIAANGNVTNANNSYGAISDIKLKENIVDANSQWDDLKALRVRNYNFKEGQTHTQIGLVAQEVELVSPGLVTESPDRDADGNDLGTVTKSVNYSVLYMKAVKALQEAMARIEQLEQRLTDAGIA